MIWFFQVYFKTFRLLSCFPYDRLSPPATHLMLLLIEISKFLHLNVYTNVYIFIVVHTYIIGHYNPSVWIIDLVSHTTYVVCVYFIHKWRDLQFKVNSERQIFWETFHGNFYLLLEFLPEICWEEIAEEILFLYFVLMSGLGHKPWLFI